MVDDLDAACGAGVRWERDVRAGLIIATVGRSIAVRRGSGVVVARCFACLILDVQLGKGCVCLPRRESGPRQLVQNLRVGLVIRVELTRLRGLCQVRRYRGRLLSLRDPCGQNGYRDRHENERHALSILVPHCRSSSARKVTSRMNKQ
jgi:hypothetical protein